MVSNMQNNISADDRHQRPASNNRAILWGVLAVILIVAAIYVLGAIFHSDMNSPTLASNTASNPTPGTASNEAPATTSPTPLTPAPNTTP